jgi:hypothetical protein
MISSADVSWVLHRAGDAAVLEAEVGDHVFTRFLSVRLPQGWKKKTDISRRVGAWGMRGMALGGMVMEDLADTARTQRGVEKDRMALFVKAVGQYGKHAAAKNAGFKKDDVIVELDGKSARLTESELLGQLLQHHNPGEQLKAAVLRGDQRLELSLPMQ